MSHSPAHPEPELAAVARSLARGWKLLLTVALLAAATTAAIVLRWPPLWQSHLELRLTPGGDPWRAAIGLELAPAQAVALLLGSEVRAAVAAELGGEPTEWGVEQVVAVPQGDTGVFVIARDADPDRAATAAAAVERAALAVRRSQVEAALAAREVAWRRHRDAQLTRLAELAGDAASPPTASGDQLEAELRPARRQAVVNEVVAAENWLARARLEREQPEPPWLVVAGPAPAQGMARRPLLGVALAATLLPVLLAAAVWLWVDRPARAAPPCPG